MNSHFSFPKNKIKEDAFGQRTALITFFTFFITLLSQLIFITLSGLAHAEPRPSPKKTKDNTLTIAVIDTGIDETHPLLKSYLWTNPGETGNGKESNGVDDDGNGFVDDVHGWNFNSNTNQLTDRHGHGTHISGIIVGAASPSMLPQHQIKIMVLKYYDQKSHSETVAATTQAIDYAVKMNADIINYSSGGYQKDRLEFLALKRAQDQGVLVFAAAGNDTIDTDRKPYYPASYPLKNVLSIGSLASPKKTTPRFSNFSNYGRTSIDFVTPGENILSTLPGNQLGFMSGTSQSAAIACHLALRTHLSQTRAPASEFKMQSVIAVFKKVAQSAIPAIPAQSGRLVAKVLNPQDWTFKERWKSRMITSSDFKNSKLSKKKGLHLAKPPKIHG